MQALRFSDTTTMRVLFVALLSILPAASAYAEEPHPYAIAAGWDPMRQALRRPDVPGAYRSKFGLQVHPYCFQIAKQNGIERAEAEKNFENALELSVRSIVVDCREKYPELSPYLKEWVTQARRTVLTCTQRDGEDSGFSGMNVPEPKMRYFVAPRDAWAGIPPSPVKGQIRNIQPVVVFSKDVFMEFAKRPEFQFSLEYVNTLIHELLHSTHANNRLDHNRLNYKPMKSTASCKEVDLSWDRVSAVAAMCANDHSEDYDWEKFVVAMSRKIENCGIQSCEKLFTGKHGQSGAPDRAHFWLAPFENYYLPSGGLKPEAAQRLCQRIRGEGECLKRLPEEGPEYTRDHPELNRIGKKLRQRLSEVFPDDLRITRPLLDLAPAVEMGLKRLKDNGCFKKAFEFLPNGELLYKGPGHLKARADAPKPLTGADFLESQEEKYLFMIEAFRRIPECATGEGPQEIEDQLREFRKQQGHHLFFSPPLHAALIRGGLVESQDGYEFYFSPDTGSLAVEFVIGKKLFSEYEHALSKYHYRSPKFSCEAAGYHSTRAAENISNINQTIQGAIRPAEPLECAK